MRKLKMDLLTTFFPLIPLNLHFNDFRSLMNTYFSANSNTDKYPIIM